MTLQPGKCYENAYRMMTGYGDDRGPLCRLEENIGGEVLLVHGYPKLTMGPHKGRVYGHAWLHLVKLGQVVDGGCGCLADVGLYYQVGQIKTEQCRSYCRAGAKQQYEDTGSYGPWGDVPEGALFEETIEAS